MFMGKMPEITFSMRYFSFILERIGTTSPQQMAPPHLQCKLNTQEQWTTSSPLMNNQTGKLLLFVSFKTKNLKCFKDVGWVDKKKIAVAVCGQCAGCRCCAKLRFSWKNLRDQRVSSGFTPLFAKRLIKSNWGVQYQPVKNTHYVFLSVPCLLCQCVNTVHTEQRWTCEWQMQYVTNCMLSVSHNC